MSGASVESDVPKAAVKQHSVQRLYKAGSWDALERIVCNKCKEEKDKAHYSLYRYTCKQCVGSTVRPITERTEPNKKRLYKNGAWATLETITCGSCHADKAKSEYKPNRYICTVCSKTHMRELNKRKDGGKYADLQKQYNARYEATPHGMERRREYREKLKAARGGGDEQRKVNVMNRLRTSARNIMSRILAINDLRVGAAVQYLGVSQEIFKSWIEYNLQDGMTWDTFGSTWKLHLVRGESADVFATEKDKFDAFNWRNWCPVHVNAGDATRDCRERSVDFLRGN